MASFYFKTRISEHIARSPENYLLITGARLSRVGFQTYLWSELGINKDGTVQVYRSADSVFDPLTLASGEGKSFVFNHPQSFLTIENDASFSKGHVQNIRRGTGEDADFTLGDIVVKDPTIATLIESGSLRDLSVGYALNYVQRDDGVIEQRDIRINHVALCQSGRAMTAKIRDSADHLNPKPTERLMPNNSDKDSLWGRILKAFASDASPEDLEQAAILTANQMKQTNTKAFDADEEKKDADEKKESEKASDALNTRLSRIEDALAALAADRKARDDDEEKQELKKEEKCEDSDLVSEEGEENMDKKSKDSAALTALLAMKPIVAKSNDKAIRKAYNDAVLQAKGKDSKTSSNAYGEIAAGLKRPDELNRFSNDAASDAAFNAATEALDAKYKALRGSAFQEIK